MLPQYTFVILICPQLFQNVIATNNNTVVSGWVDDPDGRGTFTIASSCVLTLSLCVYTAIHLNVRPYKRTELQSWFETTKWVVFGILAPELVVFVAWRQYVSAMALDRIVRGLQERGRCSELSSNPTFSGIKVVVSSNHHTLHTVSIPYREIPTHCHLVHTAWIILGLGLIPFTQIWEALCSTSRKIALQSTTPLRPSIHA